MSYETHYRLTIEKTDSSFEAMKRLLIENENAKFALNEDGDYKEPCTWYEHEKELKEFSIKYPDALFVLRGEGEQNDDIWIKYFQNGKMQVCQAKITFDKFNRKKLV